MARSLPIASRLLGVSGECDVVEFHRCEDGVKLHGHRGLFSVYPIEYKKGKPKVTEVRQTSACSASIVLGGNVFYRNSRGSIVLWGNKEARGNNDYRGVATRSHRYVSRNASIF